MNRLLASGIALGARFTLIIFAIPIMLSAESIAVKADRGTFVFSELRLDIASPPCAISGLVKNETDYDWFSANFQILANGRSGRTTVANLALRYSPTHRTIRISSDDGLSCEDFYPTSEPQKYSIAFVSGSDVKQSPEQIIAAVEVNKIEEEQRQAERDAQRKDLERRRAAAAKAAAERLARSEFLAKSPRLQSGLSSAFIGSDRKCSAQFMEAAAMDGLEKRKRLADLIAFGCGFIVPNSTHVSIERKQGSFAAVKVIDGEKTGQSGWIPLAWITPPLAVTKH